MKHFFKILLIFMGMIALGLIGIFVVNFFSAEGGHAENPNNGTHTEVAK